MAADAGEGETVSNAHLVLGWNSCGCESHNCAETRSVAEVTVAGASGQGCCRYVSEGPCCHRSVLVLPAMAEGITSFAGEDAEGSVDGGDGDGERQREGNKLPTM